MPEIKLPTRCPEGVCLAELVREVPDVVRSPAKRRAVRTLAQGVVATGLSGALEAALAAIGSGVGGKMVLTTAASAFVMSVLAALHKDESAE